MVRSDAMKSPQKSGSRRHEHMRIPVKRIGRCSRRGCQAWGGPRASKSKWSNEAGSVATTDHRKCWEAEIGGTTVGDDGVTSALARLMLAQTGQKTSGKAGRLFRRRGRRHIGRRSADIRRHREGIRHTAELAQVDVTERKHELARQRKHREPRHSAPVRSEPTHCVTAVIRSQTRLLDGPLPALATIVSAMLTRP